MKTFLLLLSLCIFIQINAQRPMEKLDRSLVVQERLSGGTFLTWRILGTDPRDVSFNLYRDEVKINENPIIGASNYVDSQGSITASYKLETIWEAGGNEIFEKPILFPLSNVPNRTRIPLKRIAITPPVVGDLTFTPGSMSVGDLTGDGAYELVFEWQSNIGTHSVLEAIDLEGNSLWKIYLGPNSDMRKLNFMVYDLNMDGKAEVSMMTGPGTVDGIGNFINKGEAANYPSDLIIERGWGNSLLDDPKFITVFDGESGAEMATTGFWPSIGPRATHEQTWGDDRGHRASSLKGGVLYNKEHGPLLVFQRGVYTRVAVSTYKWDGAEGLDIVWQFDSYDGHTQYNGQANHSPAVGDLDGDGNDEYITGPAAINHDGTPMWATRMGHGDASHLGKHIPDRPGLQFFMPHEDNVHGLSMVDVATGEVIWEKGSPSDVGRAWAADVDPRYRGSEVMAIGFPNFNNLGNEISTNYNAYDQPVYFDGEEVRAWRTQGWGINSYTHGRILTGWHYGASPNHGTKNDACLVADIMGDWREEVIFRDGNNREILIFSSWFPTERKNPTLMHDYIYRMNIVIQNVGYNQPAHTSYYFRDGYPDHDIFMVERNLSAMSFGNFYIYPDHSSLALDAIDGLTQQPYLGTGDQVFRFRREDDSFSIFNYGTEKYLGFSEPVAESPLFLTDEASKRLFKLVKDGDTDRYFIQSAEDLSLVLSVVNGSMANGAALVLAQPSDGDHDVFKLESAGIKIDCSGTWDGDAYLDNSAVCVEGSTGKFPNSENLEEGFYRIRSLDANRYLFDGGAEVGSTVDGEGDSGIWELVKDGHYFKIVSYDPRKTIHFINEDIYLVTNLTNQGNLRIEEKENAEGGSSYILTQVNSDHVLGFVDGIQDDESTLKVISRDDAGNQMFAFEQVDIDLTDCNGVWRGTAQVDDCGRCVGGDTGQLPCANFSDDYYKIRPVHSNLCFQSGASGLIQQTCSDADTQIWLLDGQEDGSYQLKNLGTDSYVSVNSVAQGQTVLMSSTASTDFYIIETGESNQSYLISPVANMGLGIDVLNVSSEPGVGSLLWTIHGGDNQKFLFEVVDVETSLVKNKSHYSDVKIFPNPADEYLNIVVDGPILENSRFEVYSVTGSLILSQKINNRITPVSIESLDAGIYLIRVYNNSKIQYVKFSKK